MKLFKLTARCEGGRTLRISTENTSSDLTSLLIYNMELNLTCGMNIKVDIYKWFNYIVLKYYYYYFTKSFDK